MIGETLKSLAFNKTYRQNIQIPLDENIFSYNKSSQILNRIGSNDQIFQSDSKRPAHARPVYIMWSLNNLHGVLIRHAPCTEGNKITYKVLKHRKADLLSLFWSKLRTVKKKKICYWFFSILSGGMDFIES